MSILCILLGHKLVPIGIEWKHAFGCLRCQKTYDTYTKMGILGCRCDEPGHPAEKEINKWWLS